jgi:uncharacterized protein YkuJ
MTSSIAKIIQRLHSLGPVAYRVEENGGSVSVVIFSDLTDEAYATVFSVEDEACFRFPLISFEFRVRPRNDQDPYGCLPSGYSFIV